MPIVIYNGDKRWNHSEEIFDLIQPHPAVLTEFQPKLRFWLLDEGRFTAKYLEGLQRVMAAIFRIERTRDTEAGRCHRFALSIHNEFGHRHIGDVPQTDYRDWATSYEAPSVARNAPRWLKMLKKHGVIRAAT